MNFDDDMTDVAMMFFKEEKDCPFCSQKQHMQYIIQGLKIETRHHPMECLYNWIGLVACIDNIKNTMTPDELRIYVSHLSGRVIEDVNTLTHGGMRKN